MSQPDDPHGLIRLYPRAWRERYGAGILAMVDDDLQGARPPLGLRASLAQHGLREHARRLVGAGGDRAAARRGGARLVLVAWSLFVVAGCAFAKQAEHVQAALPAGHRRIAADAYATVVAFAVIAAVLVAVAALALLPAFVRQVVRGRDRALDGPARLALVLVGLALAAVAAASAWGSHLSDQQRNPSALTPYGAGFLVAGALVAAAIIASAAAALSYEARLHLPDRLVRIEAGLAVGVAVCLAGMLAATLVWWAEVATHAPWFLHGTPAGSAGSPWTLVLTTTVALMVTATAIAAGGCARIARA